MEKRSSEIERLQVFNTAGENCRFEPCRIDYEDCIMHSSDICFTSCFPPGGDAATIAAKNLKSFPTGVILLSSAGMRSVP